MSLDKKYRKNTRQVITDLLKIDGDDSLLTNETLIEKVLIPMNQVMIHLPAQIIYISIVKKNMLLMSVPCLEVQKMH